MNIAIGISEFLKEDYLEIYDLSIDKDGMEETWEAWKANKTSEVKKMKAMGMYPIDIVVGALELVEYCRDNGLEVDGRARAEFVTYKMNNLDLK